MSDSQGPSTRSIHLATAIDPQTRATVPPIAASAAFAFPDLESWRAAAEGGAGDVYSRNSNPTTRILGERVAALEGAAAATTFATGMAGVTATLLALLEPGDRVVTVRDAYGATFLLFTEILPRFGIACAVCDTRDAAALEREIAGGCTLLYLETPTNPTLEIIDIRRLAAAAAGGGGITVVDNTFATPINQTPLALGADIVLHSATKYLGGHGDVLGGVVCGSVELIARIERFRELTGPSLDAHSAWLLLRSLKTLGLRVARQNDTAQALARSLDAHAAVESVFYPGLDNHPGHATARAQMRGFGGVLSFVLRGGMEAAERLLPRLRLAHLAANLGQVETVVGPASLTSHIELGPEERAASGVPDHLIRYAVGIEDVEDLRADLEQALASS